MMNFKHLFTFFIFFSFAAHIYAQDLSAIDQDYLDSLPEEVRNDILKEIKEEDSDKDKVLKIPSSEISSLETVKRWEQFLKNEGIEKSERFGMQMFRSMQSTFMPINLPNLSSDYVLDIGDVLEIELYGSKEDTLIEEIARDGSITIKEVGKVFISGKSLAESTSLIEKSVNDIFIGTDVYVNIKSLRDIQVLITGFSKFPGIYTLGGNTNILHALNVSGGISNDGSLRLIDIKRDGKVLKTFDLYESLIFGNIDFQDTLRSGDSIYIHPAQKLVRAGNGFVNTGIFELKNDENFADFLKFSGGLSRDVSTEKISINTFQNGKFNKSITTLDQLLNLTPNNNDSLYAVQDLYGVIKISGEVFNPGTYEISSEETIKSIIERAGGYKDGAYPFGGVLLREEAKEIERKNNLRLYNNFIKYIASSISKGTGSQVGTSLPTVLNELKNVQVFGRVQAEFDLINLNENVTADIFLADKDEIIIPKFQPIVYIYGEVQNPGGMKYSPNLSTKDYIKFAGGFTNYSNTDKVIVVDPSGSAKVYTNRNINFNLNNSIDIYPGSLIYVTRDIDKVAGLEFTAASASIFSSLALALASLNSIN